LVLLRVLIFTIQLEKDMKSKIVIGIAAVVLLSVMVANAYACYGPGLSPGFWKHNLGVWLGLANGAYSDPGYTGGIVSKATMGAWLTGLDATLEMKALYDDLCTVGGGATGAATRVAAANVFNAAAGLSPY
jgi:hypothetical protein